MWLCPRPCTQTFCSYCHVAQDSKGDASIVSAHCLRPCGTVYRAERLPRPGQGLHRCQVPAG